MKVIITPRATMTDHKAEAVQDKGQTLRLCFPHSGARGGLGRSVKMGKSSLPKESKSVAPDFKCMHPGFAGGLDGKGSACNVGCPALEPGSGRSPGEGNG